MAEEVMDRYGHRIYLTAERWKHLVSEPPEMAGCRRQLLEVLQRGRRRQEARDPSRYRYIKAFQTLDCGNNCIVAIVKFGFSDDGSPNNFVLTAYQKFVYALQR